MLHYYVNYFCTVLYHNDFSNIHNGSEDSVHNVVRCFQINLRLPLLQSTTFAIPRTAVVYVSNVCCKIGKQVEYIKHQTLVSSTDGEIQIRESVDQQYPGTPDFIFLYPQRSPLSDYNFYIMPVRWRMQCAIQWNSDFKTLKPNEVF